MSETPTEKMLLAASNDLPQLDLTGCVTQDCTLCHFERDEKEGITIYYPSDWDNGIGFEHGEAIFCPKCGRPITHAAKLLFLQRMSAIQPFNG